MLQPSNTQKTKNPVNVVGVYKTLRVPMPSITHGDCAVQYADGIHRVMACSGIRNKQLGVLYIGEAECFRH